MKDGTESDMASLLGLSPQEFVSLTHSLYEKLRAVAKDAGMWDEFWKFVRAKKGKEHDAAIFLATMYMVSTGSVYPDRGE